ncbi:MAG: hypothetical protein V2A74_06265 [bacterium]
MKAGALSVLITGFWLAMMYSLVKDRIIPQRQAQQLEDVEPAQLTQNWHDYEEWMSIRFQNRSIGYSMTRLERAPNLLWFDLQHKDLLSINAFGLEQRILLQAAARLDEQFALESFIVEVRANPLRYQIAGFVHSGRLYYKVEAAGPPIYRFIPLPNPISLMEAVRPLLVRDFFIEPGKVYRIPVVDPIWSLERGMMEVEVLGQESMTINDEAMKVFHVESRLGEMKTQSWYASDGTVVRRELYKGVEMVRTTQEDVLRDLGTTRWARTFVMPIEIPEFNLTEFMREATPSEVIDENDSALKILERTIPWR